MKTQMTTPTKKESQKHLIILDGFLLPVLFWALLACSLVFPFSYSNAGDGVNSNTITSGTTTTTSTGTSTSTTVTNSDNSETTTTTTPITTTSVETTVTQTNVGNVVENPNFTNHLGGGSSTNWTIEACGGNGCAFGPTHGFMTSHGTGRISQTQTAEDLGLTSGISAEEAGQGFSFSFGADVRNNFRNQIGNNYTQGGTTDSWSIKLEVFDGVGSSLGSESIGFHGCVNCGSTNQTNQAETGTLHINSGNIVATGEITLEGRDLGSWDGYYGPRFNNVFTTFVYNDIVRETTTGTTYTDLITTIGCDTLNTCEEDIAQLLTTTINLTSDTTTEIAELTIEPIAAPVDTGPAPTENAGTSMAELTPAPIEMPTIQAPVMAAPAQSFSPEASVETEIQAEISNDIGASIDTPVTTDSSESGSSTQNTPEPGPEPATEAATPEPESGPEPENNEAKPEVAEAKPESNDSSGGTKSEAKNDTEESSEDVQEEPNSKPEVAKKQTAKKEQKATPKKMTKKQQKRKAKQKAAKKIVKKMGDKGKYEGGNQLKTLVIMSVLGNSREFFSTQRMLPDTPGFFQSTRVPDTQITDNSAAAYYMIGSSSAVMDELIESQYK